MGDIRRILRGIELSGEHNLLEQRSQRRVDILVADNRNTDHCCFTTGNIQENMLRLNRETVDIDHILICRNDGVKNMAESGQCSLLVHSTTEELIYRNLGGNIVL